MTSSTGDRLKALLGADTVEAAETELASQFKAEVLTEELRKTGQHPTEQPDAQRTPGLGLDDSGSDNYPLIRANMVKPTKAGGVATQRTQGSMTANRQSGELAPAGTKFCLIVVVSRLPYQQMKHNSGESKQVSEVFFTHGKFWTRKWTL